MFKQSFNRKDCAEEGVKRPEPPRRCGAWLDDEVTDSVSDVKGQVWVPGEITQFCAVGI